MSGATREGASYDENLSASAPTSPRFPRQLDGCREMAAPATQGASLTDLREDEKLKIGNLLRELARSQREAQQASNDRQEYATRLQRMRVQNDSIIQVR